MFACSCSFAPLAGLIMLTAVAHRYYCFLHAVISLRVLCRASIVHESSQILTGLASDMSSAMLIAVQELYLGRQN